MTVDQVINTLPMKWISAFGENVYLDIYDSFISPENFVDKFGGEGSSLTYDWLYNHEMSTPNWQNQFEEWHNKDII